MSIFSSLFNDTTSCPTCIDQYLYQSLVEIVNLILLVIYRVQLLSRKLNPNFIQHVHWFKSFQDICDWKGNTLLLKKKPRDFRIKVFLYPFLRDLLWKVAMNLLEFINVLNTKYWPETIASNNFFLSTLVVM